MASRTAGVNTMPRPRLPRSCVRKPRARRTRPVFLALRVIPPRRLCHELICAADIITPKCGPRKIAGALTDPIRANAAVAVRILSWRGAVMAADLAGTPKTGIRVQACGDCHVSNFGGSVRPERRLVFDINDFDETLHAPWEWDVKRLATSIVLAGRQKGAGERHCADGVRVTVESYREHIRDTRKCAR